jgi:geranylgeranylglycerol-phosphate geranylgeranyltransferase
MDQEVDRVAHPGRPLPTGRVAPGQALRFAIVCFMAGIVLAALIVTAGDVGLLPVLLAALAITLLLGYEVAFKYRGLGGWVGNETVAALSALTFVFGASVVAEPGNEAWVTVVLLFALADSASLGREVTKDIEDMEADRGSRSTLPMTVGAGGATALAVVAIVSAVALSPLPYLVGDMGWPYLAVVLAADVAFIYSLPFVRSSPGDAQRIHKAGMMLALIAFLVGSLSGGIS